MRVKYISCYSVGYLFCCRVTIYSKATLIVERTLYVYIYTYIYIYACVYVYILHSTQFDSTINPSCLDACIQYKYPYATSLDRHSPQGPKGLDDRPGPELDCL